MFPEIDVHRPQGILPGATVRRRTVLDVQPGLLLLVAAAALLLLRRRSSRRAAAATKDRVFPNAGQQVPHTMAPPGTSSDEIAHIRETAAEAQARPLP